MAREVWCFLLIWSTSCCRHPEGGISADWQLLGCSSSRAFRSSLLLLLCGFGFARNLYFTQKCLHAHIPDVTDTPTKLICCIWLHLLSVAMANQPVCDTAHVQSHIMFSVCCPDRSECEFSHVTLSPALDLHQDQTFQPEKLSKAKTVMLCVLKAVCKV